MATAVQGCCERRPRGRDGQSHTQLSHTASQPRWMCSYASGDVSCTRRGAHLKRATEGTLCGFGGMAVSRAGGRGRTDATAGERRGWRGRGAARAWACGEDEERRTWDFDDHRPCLVRIGQRHAGRWLASSGRRTAAAGAHRASDRAPEIPRKSRAHRAHRRRAIIILGSLRGIIALSALGLAGDPIRPLGRNRRSPAQPRRRRRTTTTSAATPRWLLAPRIETTRCASPGCHAANARGRALKGRGADYASRAAAHKSVTRPLGARQGCSRVCSRIHRNSRLAARLHAWLCRLEPKG